MDSARDSGLVRSIGTWGLAASIINIVIGAGIFAVPAALAGSIGPFAPLVFVVCAIAIGAVAICFAEGGSRIATSGGAYGYIEAAFGPAAGYVAGTLLWFGNVLACAGVAAALADMTTTLVSESYASTTRMAVVVGAIGAIALTNIAGAKQIARFVSVATVVKLIPLAIFIAAGAGAIRLSNFTEAAAPSTEGFGRAIILALFAYTGMEAPLSASGEVTDPARTIPRALAISMVAVAAIYVVVQIIAQGILGTALGDSSAPLADAMGAIHPALRTMMLAGMALSMFAWIGSDNLGTPRMLFAFARAGVLPRVLARVHPRTHTPYVAIIIYSLIAVGFAVSGSFAELAVLAALTGAVFYIAGCAAAWRLTNRGVALNGAPLNFRFLRPAAVVGIVAMLMIIALASAEEIVGLAAVIGVSALLYLISKRVARPLTAPA